MKLALLPIDLPFHLRTEHLLTDEEFEVFCSENAPFKMERGADGELVVMSPTWTEFGEVESRASGYLFIWTLADGRGKYYGSSSGFTLPDTSVRSADAAWLSLDRWNRLSAEQRQGYSKVCPEFVIEVR